MYSFMTVCQIYSAWLQLSGKIKIHITYCMWHLVISKWFANIHPQNTPTKCIWEKKEMQKSKQFAMVTEKLIQNNTHLDTTYFNIPKWAFVKYRLYIQYIIMGWWTEMFPTICKYSTHQSRRTLLRWICTLASKIHARNTGPQNKPE